MTASMVVKKISLLVLNIFLSVAMADFTTNCPQECRCLWASGSKKADCSKSRFSEIPKTLNTEIQILDLTGNELVEIKNHAFKDIGLINLKKLYCRENKLRTLHKSGLSGLNIMIEIDLSYNDLKILHPDTFRGTSKIRWILLSGNQIETLEDGLFNNLPFLQKVDLSNNKIVTVRLKTFMDVPKLNIVRLNSNKLEYVHVNTLNMITSLSNLDMHDNPWKCDCNLLPFRNWIITNNFYTLPIACKTPSQVQGKMWNELHSSDYICQPSIAYSTEKTTTMASDTNAKLSCRVDENLLPEVNWVLNAQIKDGTYRYQGEIKYFLPQNSSENKWINLTINLCVAKNMDGDSKQSLTLAIAPTIPGVIVQ